jgi:hypothetical protein
LYEKAGLGTVLVANSTTAYVDIATKLAMDREFAYALRVKIVESIEIAKIPSMNCGDCLEDLKR